LHPGAGTGEVRHACLACHPTRHGYHTPLPRRRRPSHRVPCDADFPNLTILLRGADHGVTSPEAPEMGMTVCLLNLKGGVGKTSTCYHVAGALAEGGRLVLLCKALKMLATTEAA
jgi:AAA domain-containing protein